MGRAKQDELPGMGDRKLKDLHGAAEDFIEHRDAVKELKEKILSLMHKYKLERYIYNGLEIDITPQKESVKVKSKPPQEEEEDAA